MWFQQLLNWILGNCVWTFTFAGHNYILGRKFWHDVFILGVNFGFWVILAFLFCFSIKFVKWCVRKCLRK